MDPKLPDRLLQAALKTAQAEVGDLPRTVGHSVVADVATNLGRSHTLTSRYELVELLGRGGMGLVWRAIDHDLQREVALKVLRTEYQISPAAIGRFVTESQIAGRLQHAGIVPVYELGTYPDGRVYLVMKLVHGQTLQDWLQRSPPIADRISVFVSLCQTMAYAHSQGVLHRDLKPVNIMLGSFGEVFVMDWGLATYRSSRNDGVVAASETRFDNETQAGAVLGTPDYLAPEHCAGTLAPWAETSDVYSLGVILFELLTQKRWVEQRNPSEVDDPQLHAIVEKCVALTPSKRWPNAAALAAAMLDFRADQERRLQEANLARQAAEIRAEAERRRQRLWIALIASIAIGAVGLTTILTRNRLEKQARATAEANRLAMVETSVNDLLREADRFLANGQHDRAKPLIGKAEGIAEGESGPLQASVRQRLAEVQLLAELESIRLKRSTNPGSNTRRYSQYDRAGFVYDRDASEYFARAFRTFGVDVETQTHEEIVTRLRDRVIRPKLVSALDEWAANAESRSLQTRLRGIAEQLDPLPGGLAHRVRQALSLRNKSELLAIANSLTSELAPSSPAEVLFLVAHALRRAGNGEQAVQLLTNAVSHHATDFWLNLELAAALAVQSPNDSRVAEPSLATAFALSNGNPDVYTYVAVAHVNQNQLPQAEAALRRTLARDPRSLEARFRLAYVLTVQRRLAEARKLVDEILELGPNNPVAYFDSGVLLHLEQKTLPEAVAAYRRSIELDPNWPEVWNNLGNALTALRQPTEAVAAFTKALELRPDYPRAIYNLAVLQDAQNRTAEAIAGYRRVLELDAEFYEAAYNLAHDLTYQMGQFAEVTTLLEKNLQLVPSQESPRWKRLLDDVRRKATADAMLTEFLKSAVEPTTARERTELAVAAAWPHRQQFVTATRLWEAAFQREPKLADDLVQGYRYFAAGCAALAAAGLGDEARRLSEPERTQVRSLALQWLQADLAIRQKQAEDQKQRPAVHAALRYWLTDANLRTVRDEAILAKLPEAEREVWQLFWKHVRKLEQDLRPAQ